MNKEERKNTLYYFVKRLMEAEKHTVKSEALWEALKDEIGEIDAMEE